jgi:uncharacterized membrane protein YccC
VDFGSRPTPLPPADRPSPAPSDGKPDVQNLSEAKDKAADAAQAGKQAVSDVAGTATDAAKDVAQQASEQAKDLVGKTRSQLSEQASAQQHSLVETLRDLGDQLAGMADTDKDGTAVELVTQARDYARNAADWLDQREPSQVVDELRDLGRRRPGAFLFGSAMAGVLAGRLTRGVAAVHKNSGSDSDAGIGSHRELGS